MAFTSDGPPDLRKLCPLLRAQLSTMARQLPANLESGSASLPTVSSFLCRFLDEVQSHSDVNKMSVQNLATVFGPNILRPQVEDPVTIMEGNGGGVRGGAGCSGLTSVPGKSSEPSHQASRKGGPAPGHLEAASLDLLTAFSSPSSPMGSALKGKGALPCGWGHKVQLE